MNNNLFSIWSLKQMAYDKLRGQWLSMALITFVFFLVFLLVASVPFVGVILQFAVLPLSFGFTYLVFLGVVRGEYVSVSTMFNAFNKFGRHFAAVFLPGFYALMWAAPFIAVCILLVFLGLVQHWNIFNSPLALLLMVSYIGVLVMTVYKFLSYSMTGFIVVDEPETSVKDAIKKSQEMMDGHKFDLFKLNLSFMGWSLLLPFTLFIGVFFLIPYIATTNAEFYCALSGKSESQIQTKSDNEIEDIIF